VISIIKYPDEAQLSILLARPAFDNDSLAPAVAAILSNVKKNGDAALAEYNQRFDGYASSALEVSDEEWSEGATGISDDLKAAIDVAIDNISKFHSSQREEIKVVMTMNGVQCWRKSVGIERVGIYIPGGTAPLLSTLLMLAIPAKIAGCREVVMCTPPGKDGVINKAILYAAKRTGVNRIFKAGGAQAIAAMAYGTQSIPQVYKIFGPGNQYVTAAKIQVQSQGVAIDLPAGPSEVAVLADDSCVPAFVAADLLSQAEHGIDSQVLLVTDSEMIAAQVNEEVARQLPALPRKEIAAGALANSKIIVVRSIQDGMKIINEYAPEHLIIATANANELANDVINAGSVFIGNYTPESAGDYASGTNHTLPTNGHARAYSGVSLDSFVKKITFQQIDAEGLKILGNTITQMATAEGLYAHADAVSIRLKTLENE
jgi:histidinol dehydrogenase